MMLQCFSSHRRTQELVPMSRRSWAPLCFRLEKTGMNLLLSSRDSAARVQHSGLPPVSEAEPDNMRIL
jgi:hypothetical protein